MVASKKALFFKWQVICKLHVNLKTSQVKQNKYCFLKFHFENWKDQP